MMDGRRWLVVLALAAIAGLSWWFARDTTAPPLAPDAKLRHDPDYLVEKFTATAMNERGSPKYVLTADRLTHYPDDDTAHYDNPVVVQYKPSGARTAARSDTGVMPGDGRDIVMDGNVHVTNAGDPRSPGGELITQHLRIELDK